MRRTSTYNLWPSLILPPDASSTGMCGGWGGRYTKVLQKVLLPFEVHKHSQGATQALFGYSQFCCCTTRHHLNRKYGGWEAEPPHRGPSKSAGTMWGTQALRRNNPSASFVVPPDTIWIGIWIWHHLNRLVGRQVSWAIQLEHHYHEVHKHNPHALLVVSPYTTNRDMRWVTSDRKKNTLQLESYVPCPCIKRQWTQWNIHLNSSVHIWTVKKILNGVLVFPYMSTGK